MMVMNTAFYQRKSETKWTW